MLMESSLVHVSLLFTQFPLSLEKALTFSLFLPCTLCILNSDTHEELTVILPFGTLVGIEYSLFLLMGFNFYQLTLMEALCGASSVAGVCKRLEQGEPASRLRRQEQWLLIVPRMQRHHRLCSKEHLPKCPKACSFSFIHGPLQS